MSDIDWRKKAKCLGRGTAQFFPSIRYDRGDDAKAICDQCPVRKQCGQEALDLDERHGIRAGFRLWMETERAQLQRYVQMEPRKEFRRDSCLRCGEEFSTRMRRVLCAKCDGRVPAEPIRAQVRALKDAGMTNRQIIAASGVPWGSFNGLVYGKKGAPPQRYIAREAAERIMAVEVPVVSS
ncbi:WhiB family transcriptional regulator [Nocardia sp. NPDC019302]|uniref:WhiB family transcriptional regulator n=1 Tax=Nocardia sp. NPDC019302 TaxID=3154592 RepID=UPI0033C55CDF